MMARSIQEILDHAEELADRFEAYEPEPGDEVDVAEHLLRRAALAHTRSQRQVARAAGLSWERIGKQLGTTADAAQQRFATLSDTA